MHFARPDPAYLQQLEKAAARNPRWYRYKVSALALWGDFMLTTAQLLPVLLPVGVGLLVLNATVSNPLLFNIAGGVVFVLLVWITRPDARFSGSEIKPVDAPEFFQALDALRAKLDVAPRMRVMLDDEFNASAGETRGLFGFWGRQQTLTLGVPLLCMLTRNQALAVIGHEFGHFSRRHGRFGHWLYRARDGWLHYAQDATQSATAWQRAAALFAERFVPYFSTYSFVLARECEYQADADAASATSAADLAQALTRLAVLSRLWSTGIRREIRGWRLAETEAPGDFLDRVMDAFRNWPVDDLQRWQRQALEEVPNWIDTHPLLQQRVDAVRQPPQLGFLAERCAGDALFGAAWAGIKKQFNEQWQARAQRNWLFYRARQKDTVQPLLAMNTAQAAQLPYEQQLLRAEAQFDADWQAGKHALQDLLARRPQAAEVVFRTGFALAPHDQPQALKILSGVATLDSSYRIHSYRALHGLYESLGDGKQADIFAGRAEAAHAHASRAFPLLQNALMKGEAVVSPLLVSAGALLAQVAREDAAVVELWLFACGITLPLALARDVTRDVTYPMQFVMLRVDYEILRKLGGSEEEIIDLYTGYVQTLTPSNTLIASRVVLTTETPERWIGELLSKFPGARCFRREGSVPAEVDL